MTAPIPGLWRDDALEESAARRHPAIYREFKSRERWGLDELLEWSMRLWQERRDLEDRLFRRKR